MAADASIRPETDSRSQTSLEDLGEPPLQAAKRVWYVWLIGIVALVATAYFSTTRGLWSNYGEVFYAVFFGVVTLVAFAYGTYTVYDQTRAL